MEIKYKKLQSPPYEEMEPSQRTGQLFYVLLGEGHPVGDHPNVIPIMCQEHFGAGRFRSYAFGVIKSVRFAVISCKR
jgi:hypothetical protein